MSLKCSLDSVFVVGLGNIKCTSDVVFVGSFLDVVLDQYVRGGMDEETAAKNAESVHCR